MILGYLYLSNVDAARCQQGAMEAVLFPAGRFFGKSAYSATVSPTS
jgi:hypothetical protein